MTPLHPRQLKLMRIRGALGALVAVGLAFAADIVLDQEGLALPGIVTGPVVSLTLLALVFLPRRRYRAWGYREDEDELHVRHGLLMRVRTIVPFGRVQHIDISHGPVERRLGLATLTLHTAGTRTASVSLPGLLEAEAEQMRDRIRAKIRQDLV